MRRLKLFLIVPVLAICLIWFCYRDQVLEIFFTVWNGASPALDEPPSFGFSQPSLASHESEFPVPDNSSSSTSIPSEIISVTPDEDEALDYTDPLDVSRNLFYGPWRASIPEIVTAGDEFNMVFNCTYPDQRLCPSYFMVLFHGPTRQSVLPDMFSQLNRTGDTPASQSTLTATWTINDPGEYKVYAYPQFVYCKQWETMDYPWEKASVEGSPFRITVLPAPSPLEEGYGTCSGGDADNGRYLSTADGIASTEFQDMYAGQGREFVFAPYKCKVPPRTIHQALSSIPSAKHFLFIGDSMTRGGFCTRIWEQLHGSVWGSVCDYKTNSAEYWDMKWGHKFTNVLLDEDTDHQRNVSFSFLWVAHNFSSVVPTLLSLTDPPPTHVVFNMALWVAWEDPTSLESIYWNFLELMKTNFPGVQHIIFRTMTSVVQAVQCYGEYNIVYSEKEGGIAPPEDSLDFRLGGSRKRHVIFDVARKWNKQYEGNSSFKVSVVDAWMLTDNRPETTSEGRHWIDENNGYWSWRRRGIGEAEASVQDRIFDDFINERITN